MEFGWNEGQQARYDEVLDATRDAFPAAPGAGHGFYTRKDWLRLGEIGMLGSCLPKEYGGQGLGALDTARVVEAVGRGCADTGLVFGAAAHTFACAVPLARFGGDALRRRLLPELAAGRLIAGNAMTEPEAGSDSSRLGMTATPTDGGFVLNGTKSFVSNGPAADVYVTYATVNPKMGFLGVTGLVVDRDTPGVVVGKPYEKMGLHSCPAGPVTFEDCFVPEEQVLGGVGAGAAIFQHSMGWERACLFALYLGLLDRLVEQCVAHARERRQFGRRIGEFQSVANRIADMKLRLESARLLLYRACWSMDQGDASVLEIALSKLAVSEGVLASAADAVRVFGGRGYLREDGIEAALRDAVPSTIFSGTSDIQRQLIVKEIGL
ncbi:MULTISPECIES: acyl-CoA dehydrogenase family protein [unclassified Streptomyces]|uniref:acyl-CoA dehydrogenase family protein n=1 Tax=unclassified Streptomyces TaxID=2593676 RepID=UPI002E8131E5|nr:acyl-CoA dehydrogenase family protein [Streptomyces sp. NBC_00589]WTI35002.1 acyl-CoA dehydrogenase family protein [Streptomyces sp. NBC_00775]WUB31324.1 acyl-CoA dehydrogenase family protein [Streptomyces sp. NBC_00589]